ncbi:MAG: hypothetical protein RSC51_03915 [Oscillospiraceae bacterium]
MTQNINVMTKEFRGGCYNSNCFGSTEGFTNELLKKQEKNREITSFGSPAEKTAAMRRLIGSNSGLDILTASASTVGKMMMSEVRESRKLSA